MSAHAPDRASSVDLPEPRPLEAIGLVPLSLQEEVRRAIAGLHIELDLWGATELVVARLESARPALLLIDTDLLGCPVDLCTFARSLQPGVKVFGLVNHWSEREEGLHACADGFLHKPARDAEWKAVLRRFGVRDAHIAGGQSFTASSQDGAERPADQLRSALSDTPSQYCDKGDGRKKHSKEVQ